MAQEFNFKIITPIDSQLIREYHRLLAKQILNKYGYENTRRILEAMNTKEE